MVQPIPDFSSGLESYTFLSTGEWPEPQEEGRVHAPERTAFHG